MTLKKIAALTTLCIGLQAHAATWTWHYDAGAIAASGTFTTTDAPDANGFYRIVEIRGSRNGIAITGLQPVGTAIPGNDPYAVDDLAATNGAQLTYDGFGFSLADGSYANPFSDGTDYFEYLSLPPYPEGAGLETAVSFAAAPVPEPAPAWLDALALCALVATMRHWGPGRPLKTHDGSARTTAGPGTKRA